MSFQHHPPRVAVLLSTYNGQRFVGEQIESLLKQDYPALTIYIRDDGSSDNTLSIVRGYANCDPRITVIPGKNLGCVASFMTLLNGVDAEIYMFCDQDDIWLPEKVSNAASALIREGLHRPLLYHTDLQVVDEQLRPLFSSFMTQQGLPVPEAHKLEVLALQNCVVGCTVAITSRLADCAALPSLDLRSAAMHDWWLALLACCNGTLIYAPTREILYRQHGANVSGAIRRSLADRIKLQLTTAGLLRINAYRRKVALQARSFLGHYRTTLSSQQRIVLERVSDLDPDCGFFPVLRGLVAGIRFQNIYMNISLVYTAAVTALINLLSRKTC